MLELATTENLIASYRDNYNARVADYNKYVKGFPRRNILGMLGYEVQPYERLNFDVSPDAPDLFN
jgi:LemA protein